MGQIPAFCPIVRWGKCWTLEGRKYPGVGEANMIRYSPLGQMQSRRGPKYPKERETGAGVDEDHPANRTGSQRAEGEDKFG